MTYKKTFYVVWLGKRSHLHLMNSALRLARRMRQKGHAVTVQMLRKGE